MFLIAMKMMNRPTISMSIVKGLYDIWKYDRFIENRMTRKTGSNKKDKKMLP